LNVHCGKHGGQRAAESIRSRRCRICGEPSTRLLHTLGHHRLIECRHCRFVFLDAPPDAAPPDIYGEAYFRGLPGPEGTHNVEGWDHFAPENVDNHRDSCRTRMDWVEQFTNGRRLLDVGCGLGLLLAEARSRRWTVSGIDGSAFAVDYARRELGLGQVRRMDAGRLGDIGGTVDAVTMFHMVEHVAEPLKLLDAVHSILDREGRLFLETPDIGSGRARKAGADWRFVKIPEHLSYFSEKSLRKLLEQTGFGVVRMEYLVETTGLMNTLMGGEGKARMLYDRWSGLPLFAGAVQVTRRVKEFLSGRLLGDYDILRVVARKN
jgi:2-polyprenyl-3-methyl-5-hydroxy-6-metoxy-1,4-benzoquinol methylase